MRSILFVGTTLFTATALANWNAKICNGAGGCLGVTWFPNTDYTCPDGSKLTNQQVAQNLLDMDSGGYDVITKDQFPATCARDATPGANDTLVVHKAADGQKFYSFITETCRETAPVADCYNQNPNPSGNTLCQITTADGENCSQA